MMETRKLNYKLFTLVFTFAVLFAFSGNTQDKDSSGNIIDKTAAQIFITDGKKKLFEGNIRGALIKFREAIQKDKEKASAYFWTAMCHFELNNYDYALQYCDDAIKIDTLADKEVLYLRGAILHKQNKLDEAIASYEKSLIYVSAARVKDLRIKERIEQCKRAQIAMKNPPNIPIKVLDSKINSRFPDYAPVVADSGRTIYYTSRRQNTTGAGMNPYDNLFYEDIYVSTIDEDGDWTRGENDNESVVRLNTAGFDAVNDISADGTMLYLTINTDEMDIKPKTKSSDICIARQSNKEKWNSPKQVNGDVNSKYFDGSITMTGDGSRAYFVTERKDKEALGRTDIWFANVSNGRSFKEVKIMDKTINTKYDENTCFVTKDGQYLFFSSRGHEGLGGYDIFVTKNMGGNWTIPVNIGYPINTTDDDLHFKWYPELKKGYYSTIPKEDGKGDRDIVEIDFSNIDFKAHIEKLIEDKQNESVKASESEKETEVQPKTIEGKTSKTPAVK